MYNIKILLYYFPHLVNFGINHSDHQVILSASGPSITGNTFSLMCSAILVDPHPLPSNVPPPTFEWFYGPHGNASLPPGATPRSNYIDYTYTSTLQFSPVLYEYHAGMYTCRLGAGRLMNNIMVSVNGMIIHSKYKITHTHCL